MIPFGGKNKILGALQERPMNLSRIAKETKLSKPTVHHHLKSTLKNLVKYDTKTNLYSIKIDKSITDIVLSVLRSAKTIEELVTAIREKPKEGEVSKVLLDKDRLEDILHLLFARGLITTETRIETVGIDGGIFKKEECWTLTWRGCNLLNVCYYCHDPFEGKYSLAVSNTIRVEDDPEYPEYYSVLAHPTCVLRSRSAQVGYMVGQAEYHEDYCDHCGLPLSRAAIRSVLRRQNAFDLIYNLLTRNEISSLNAWKRRKVIEQFNQKYGHRPHAVPLPEDAFTGNIVKQNHFRIPLSKEFVKNHADSLVVSKEDKPHYLVFDFDDHEANFEFLTYPRLSDLERLFEFIALGAKEAKITLSNTTDRIKEVLAQWTKAHHDRLAKEDAQISTLMGDSRNWIYSQIWASLPPPFENIDTNGVNTAMHYGRQVYEDTEDYALIYTIVGKRYHMLCYCEVMREFPKRKKLGTTRSMPADSVILEHPARRTLEVEEPNDSDNN